jgi:hypothetical protein
MPDATVARDEAQRRMFVALADSAALTKRRRPALFALAVFAVSGVLAGAATTAAVALTAESRAGTSITHIPPSAAQVAATVPGDTTLFGEPYVVESAVGAVSVNVGNAPEGATELFVAFRCLGSGVETLSLDGSVIGTHYCDDTGGGSATGVKVAGAGPHTVSVSGSGAYMLWASWSSPAVHPSPSHEQSAAVADGKVTEDEYRAGFDRYRECMSASGFAVDVVDADETAIRYVSSDASVQSGVEGRCYAAEFALVDVAWQEQAR